MSLTAAVIGFVVFLLCVSVIQGEEVWAVTCTSPQICALKGSTVEMSCSYQYPARIEGRDTTIKETVWFTHLQSDKPADLRTDLWYAGRVEYICGNNKCALRIKDLRESDSAVYKFRFITNQPVGNYIDSFGITLSVTGLQVQVIKSTACKTETCIWSKIHCHSSCPLSNPTSYIWYKNGKKIQESTYYSGYFYRKDSISCAVKGHEDFPSPAVCPLAQTCNRVSYSDRNICAFKGSSVDISCTYSSYGWITSKFWFSPELSRQWQSPSQPEDLRGNSQYKGRVQVLEEGKYSTLRITDLRESDSAQYRFKFKSRYFEWTSNLPGTTLTVTDPDLQVQVIWSSTGPKLICHSSCLTHAYFFIWYKKGKKLQNETSRFYGGYVDPANSYSCAYDSYHSTPVYAPKVPSVFVRPYGDILKDSSVTLTCSSDANPAAKYTWYKNKTLLTEEPQLVFTSIQSSDSAEYYCIAENKLGRRTSESISIDVKFGPKDPSISVKPAEIVEGTSLTLTCSSDANPAANYTWYKENQTLLQGPEGIYRFTSISSEDRGTYYCKSENSYGQINSSPFLIDIQYAPKRTLVSLSPSGEIAMGSSVNLTCSSDANPAANYTWYKENDDSPKASGQIFTIAAFRPEHSGNYYCEAVNKIGHDKSTVHVIVAPDAWKSAAIGMTSAVLLVIIPLAVFLLMRRKKSLTHKSKGGESLDNRGQLNMRPLCDGASGVVLRQTAEQQDDLYYATIRLSPEQEHALYSNITPSQLHRQREEEDEAVVYATVKHASAYSAAGSTHQEGEEELSALYSTVNKNSANAK